MRLQPVLEEAEQRLAAFLRAVAFQRRRDRLAQRKTQAVLQHDADDAERRPAQCERVARAGRPLVDGEEPGQRVELVGQRRDD